MILIFSVRESGKFQGTKIEQLQNLLKNGTPMELPLQAGLCVCKFVGVSSNESVWLQALRV